ncbi:MAG TPA: RDD family protein [Kofleriaceae bacterium]|nr:RDD family protein [Kofleriaceae bacterium]
MLRAIAFIVDELVLVPFAALGYILISQGTAGYITGGVSVFAYGQAMAFYNRCVLMGETGQSWGKLLTGTKLISIRTGEPLGVGRTIVRDMCHAADFVLVVGSFFPIFDGRRQSLADKIAGSVVINVRRKSAADKHAA